MTGPAASLADRVREFVRDEVLPVEDEHDGDIAEAGGDRLRRTLQAAAASRGLLSPHGPTDCGGLGLGMVERAPVFEEAGYSLFGPLALNVHAPDEGNMHLLDRVATGRQRDRCLAPLVRGEVRSAFAMTEPPPGAGSDPAALTSRAVRRDEGWVIDAHKHFITGADGADFFIVMARTSGNPGDAGGATMFLVPGEAAGVKIVRHIQTVDRSMVGGHCEVTFTGVVVQDDDILGGLDEGFRYAQMRLGPARMTHVMRWTGAARHAHDVALNYVLQRAAFGSRMADLGMVHQMVAESEIDLAATRSLLMEACQQLDEGQRGSEATSIAKAFAGDALGRVVDRAIQMCGGMGVSRDLPVARIARELRPFRIYDGPTEVHRWSIARHALRRAGGG